MITDIYCPSCGHLMYKFTGGMITLYTDYCCPCRNIRLRDTSGKYMLMDISDTLLKKYKIKILSMDEWIGLMANSDYSKHDYFYDFRMNVPAEESCPYCNAQLYKHYTSYPIPVDYIICPKCSLILKKHSAYYMLHKSPCNDKKLEEYEHYYLTIDNIRDIYWNNAKANFLWNFRSVKFIASFLFIIYCIIMWGYKILF